MDSLNFLIEIEQGLQTRKISTKLKQWNCLNKCLTQLNKYYDCQ